MAVFSRAHVIACGVPLHTWVIAAQRLEYRGNPAFQNSKITFGLRADSRRPGLGINLTGAVQIKIQEAAAAAGPWVTRYDHPARLVPGGELSIDYYHVLPYIRLLFYAFGGDAFVRGDIQPEEAQALPAYETPPCLACASFCEVDCETGAETVG